MFEKVSFWRKSKSAMEALKLKEEGTPIEGEEAKKKRRGMSLAETLITIIIMALVGAGTFAFATSGVTKAQNSTAQSDLRNFMSAMQQTLVAHPDIVRFQPDNVDDHKTVAINKIVDYVNETVDSQWQFTPVQGAVSSGLIATSALKDPWDTPYGLYVFFNNNTDKFYTGPNGVALDTSNNVVYICVTSAGKNASGMQAGISGANLDPEGKIISSSGSIYVTDGIDDRGIIIRILDGDMASVMFGFENTGLGTLKDTYWVLGAANGGTGANNGGNGYDFENQCPATAKMGGSIDEFPDEDSIERYLEANAGTKIIGQIQ